MTQHNSLTLTRGTSQKNLKLAIRSKMSQLNDIITETFFSSLFQSSIIPYFHLSPLVLIYSVVCICLYQKGLDFLCIWTHNWLVDGLLVFDQVIKTREIMLHTLPKNYQAYNISSSRKKLLSLSPLSTIRKDPRVAKRHIRL